MSRHDSPNNSPGRRPNATPVTTSARSRSSFTAARSFFASSDDRERLVVDEPQHVRQPGDVPPHQVATGGVIERRPQHGPQTSNRATGQLSERRAIVQQRIHVVRRQPRQPYVTEARH
jgi:hypothetical protein